MVPDRIRMALKATIYKAQLELADMDRHVYTEHNLTLARHPSETDERMLIRLLAFALNAPPRQRSRCVGIGQGYVGA